MAVIPKNASTVILLRDKEPEGFEVFLLKRHEKSSFMGGNFVYPGGRVDREDGSLEICSYTKGMTFEEAYKMYGGTLSQEESFAHWIAAVRELFEEAGVLLAYKLEGNPFDFKNVEEKKRFSDYRELLQKGQITICQIAKKEKLFLALDQLYYYAHWITPEARSERFDTRFYLARHPVGQEASYDQKETMEGIWLTPLKALEENSNRKIALSPPTLKTLEDLSRFKSMDDILSSLRERETLPILPVLTKISNGALIVLPWDPEYDDFQRGAVPTSLNHGRPSGPADNTTRLILREGIWHPFCRT